MRMYIRGTNFERRCVALFRKYGYVSDRKAGSAPYDVSVEKDGKRVFICECKKTMKDDMIYVDKADIEKLYREAGKYNAIPLVLYGFNKTPIFVAKPSDVKTTEKAVKLEKKPENQKLEDFLKTFSC